MFLRTIRREEVVAIFILQNYKPNFENNKIPPSINEFDDFNKTLDKFEKASVPNKPIARKSQLKTKNFSRFEKKYFWYINWI